MQHSFFRKKNGFISIKNKYDDYQIKLIPTKAVMMILGCDVSRHFYPIMLPNLFDLCVLFPKCLSFDLSFDCTKASKPNQKDAQQHIVFWVTGKTLVYSSYKKNIHTTPEFSIM